MGMFDSYVLDPSLRCTCGRLLDNWQGKDGPCQGWTWRQKRQWPDGQERSWMPPELRLPAEFDIDTDCDCGLRLDAVGVCNGGVWTSVERLRATDLSTGESSDIVSIVEIRFYDAWPSDDSEPVVTHTLTIASPHLRTRERFDALIRKGRAGYEPAPWYYVIDRA